MPYLSHKKHRTSICEGGISGSSLTCTTNVVGSSVIHPGFVVKVNGHKFHALLDSGASHSYVSSTLIHLIRARAVKSGTRRVATLLGVTTTKLSEYDLCLQAVKGDFSLYTRVTRIDKRGLLMLDNPRYAERIAHHSHLYGIELDDQSQDERLPVHMILGSNEYAQIRTRTQPREGHRGEPLAEFTRFGWALMAPGIDTDVGAGFWRSMRWATMKDYVLWTCSVEPAPLNSSGRQFCMPHRVVIRENAETTKLRIVYDCSARGQKGAPSLNDCLEPGPPLQNNVYDVLVRGRFHSIAFAADMRKAFLQVRIRESDRDALRFHWLRDLNSYEVITLRFTRALYGLATSPFLLGRSDWTTPGVVEQAIAPERG